MNITIVNSILTNSEELYNNIFEPVKHQLKKKPSSYIHRLGSNKKKLNLISKMIR